ncbi:MAG: SigB/SigF/SigG family RNA polymerase sigma factor [Erysipelotrichaceae bacterium]|nr:SigB/SigF/SigG family RNA polymerase sigma factor [Erysipelotrichaceae bacterium]
MGKFKVDLCGVNTSELPVLSNEEMRVLFQKLKEGDKSAKEKLILGNLKLVLAMVQRFAHRTDNMDDLFQIGCVGLIKAIDNFDLKHEVRFSTYAVPMIIGEMKRHLRDNQMIRVSRHLKDLAYQALKVKEQMQQENDREPTNAQIAEVLKVSEKEIDECLEAIGSVLSIFEPVYNDDGDALYLLDQIQDEKDEIEQLMQVMSLRQSLETLSDKEFEIIKKRYFDAQTQTEIAEELGISQAQVSRIEKSTLNALKKNL